MGLVAVPELALGFLFYTMPAFRLGEFILGIAIALAMRGGWRSRMTLRRSLIFAAGMYALLMAGTIATMGSPGDLPYVVVDLWMLPGFVAIIASAASNDFGGRESGYMRASVPVRRGQWSFALYLVHELVIRATETFVDGLTTWSAAPAALVVLIVNVGLFGLLYEIFERPVEKRLRAWAKPKGLAAHAR